MPDASIATSGVGQPNESAFASASCTDYGKKEVPAIEAFGFTAKTIDKKTVSLRSYRGRVVVLVLIPAQLPNEVQLASQIAFEKPELDFIGIYEGFAPEIAARRYAFPVIADTDGKILGHFPHTRGVGVVAIDARGRFYRDSTATAFFGNVTLPGIEMAIEFAKRPPCRVRVEPTPSLSGPCVLNGLVQRKSDSSPVANAALSVQLFPPTEASYNPLTKRTVTGPDGRFSFSSLACGKYRVFVAAPGLTTQTIEVAATMVGESVPPISLQGFGEVSGIVVDARGAPIKGASVSPCRGWSYFMPQKITGADGRFSLAGLRAGTNQIIATLPGAHGGTSAWVDIEEGAPATMRIEATTTRITGTVTNAKADIEVRATLQKVERCEQTSPRVGVSGTSRFELIVAPGLYMVEPVSRSLKWKGNALSVVPTEKNAAFIELEDTRP